MIIIIIMNMDTNYRVVKEHEVPPYVIRRIRVAIEKGENPAVSLLDESGKLIFKEYSFNLTSKEYMVRHT